MTPSTVAHALLTRLRESRPAAPAEHGGGRVATRAVVTHAELAECTCPEHCERDHELD